MVTGGSPNHVLRFLTFQESPYETRHSVDLLNALGKTGSIVLFEGVRTGTAKMAVRLAHSEYKHVTPAEVIVVTSLIIIASDVTIMPFDSFTYRVGQVLDCNNFFKKL